MTRPDYHTLTIDVPKNINQTDLIKAVDMLLQKRLRKELKKMEKERKNK